MPASKASKARSAPIGRVMAQLGMVMNLDKCIGCHTCSVTCKQAWTNRAGVEYVWFNNVETRPGQGYPRRHEDQQAWKGGWTLNRRGRLTLRTGGRMKRLLGIFASPVQPKLEDYYEPWTYDYESPAGSTAAHSSSSEAASRSATFGTPPGRDRHTVQYKSQRRPLPAGGSVRSHSRPFGPAIDKTFSIETRESL
jgi:nitrate reductase beta subunit